MTPIFFLGICLEQSNKAWTYLKKKNSLIEEHDIFWKIVPNWVYFGQGEDLELNAELSAKVQYSRNQAMKNSLNEAILLMEIKEALLSR